MQTVSVLTPSQEEAAAGILSGSQPGSVTVLKSKPGRGRTTVLRHVHAALGGELLGMRQFMNSVMSHQPSALEEAFLQMLDRATASHDTVIVDDLHLVAAVVGSCDYARTYLLDAALTAALADAAMQKKTLIFGVEDEAPWPIGRRAYTYEIAAFTACDYGCLCGAWLGAETAGRLDYARVFRFAPALNAWQLKNACTWLRREAGFDTARFVEYLQSQDMASNVELGEVQRVDWNDLKGADDVIRALESKVALPFENDDLASRFELKPKRGVLLAGPPGTGKTTIGRALAHRLKSKFFLIDGTMIAGTDNFYRQVRQVFEAAKKNAPAIIFIDDADVIFEGNEDRGLYRYLLTMLDGLESASAGRVCVMMTAMNVNSLPHAMVRSGRVELWLETRLPGCGARADILRAKLAKLPPPIGEADVERLAAASRGLTGADLKAVVEDGKLLYAHDVANRQPQRDVEEYFLEAIGTIRGNQSRFARRRPARLPGAAAVGFIGEADGAE
ncbi:MAG TPA: ATP-binding protein [Bryobacteraceae bacterium]|nr:ATP-binding protein [Bryobacteraceae bacterium]